MTTSPLHTSILLDIRTLRATEHQETLSRNRSKHIRANRFSKLATRLRRNISRQFQ